MQGTMHCTLGGRHAHAAPNNPRSMLKQGRLTCAQARSDGRRHDSQVSSAHGDAPTAFPVGIARAALAMSASVLLAFGHTQPAHAVSGGGGMGSSLAYKDMSGQDLRKAKYNKADLRGADFSGSNLAGVPMFGAICVDAKFVGTDLSAADLESADLEGADLTNAVLQGTLLTNAQWKRVASIEGADFTDALIRKDVEASLCRLAKGTNPTTGTDTRESLHCR
ncbi:CPLD61 [Auxenochlorella protothecoides x Auxenochlorella symbiontica]